MRNTNGDDLIMNDKKEGIIELSTIVEYFTLSEWIIIISIAAVASLIYVFGFPSLLPGGDSSTFAHGFLKMPGPGAGIVVASGYLCFWMILGAIRIKKSGTAILILLMIAAMLNSAKLVYTIQTVGNLCDFFILVLMIGMALILELMVVLPLENKPWRFIFPSILGILGLVTLILMITGNAKMGEDGITATFFPLGYAASGIFALGFSIICFSYPTARYIVGAGIAQMFFISFAWMFRGMTGFAGKSGFASWAPVPLAVPALLTFACACGAVMAALAYGVCMLWDTYSSERGRLV